MEKHNVAMVASLLGPSQQTPPAICAQFKVYIPSILFLNYMYMCIYVTTTRSETSADTTETSTTPQNLDSSTTVGNRTTESAQTGSGCSAGCIAGAVVGAVVLVTAIGIVLVVVIFITKK